MAQSTLQEMANQVQIYCPSVPYFLAQRWIIDRYRQVSENNLWSFKIGEGIFSTPVSYTTGTVSVTNGSTTVTGSSTVWTSAMVDRQIQINGFIFNIESINTGAQTLVIDRSWSGDAASAQTYTILQAYISPQALFTDFHSFLSVIDPTNGWLLRLGFTSMELDRVDARRSSAGTPTLLASRSLMDNYPRYELWPYSTTARQYPFIYEKRVTDLSTASDTPAIIIRSDILVKGALADLSRWPGTREDPNPFYDPYFNQYKTREAEFQSEVNKIMIADQNIYTTDLTYFNSTPFAPMDSKFMQNHAF